MLTPEQRAEGRRLLEAELACHTDTTHWEPECADLVDWLWEHREALLADPAIDVAEIKRQAVQWTVNAPEQPGFYWCYEAVFGVFVLQITASGPGNFPDQYITMNALKNARSKGGWLEHAKWSGPIEPPPAA